MADYLFSTKIPGCTCNRLTNSLGLFLFSSSPINFLCFVFAMVINSESAPKALRLYHLLVNFFAITGASGMDTWPMNIGDSGEFS